MTDVEKTSPTVPAALEWEYAPAPESRDIVGFDERYGLFIGGEQVEPRSREWFPTISPSSEEVLADVAQAGEEDVDLAVAAAREAFDERLVGAATVRAREVPVPHRTHPAGALARARGRRVARRRQADQGVP